METSFRHPKLRHKLPQLAVCVLAVDDMLRKLQEDESRPRHFTELPKKIGRVMIVLGHLLGQVVCVSSPAPSMYIVMQRLIFARRCSVLALADGYEDESDVDCVQPVGVREQARRLENGMVFAAWQQIAMQRRVVFEPGVRGGPKDNLLYATGRVPGWKSQEGHESDEKGRAYSSNAGDDGNVTHSICDQCSVRMRIHELFANRGG